MHTCLKLALIAVLCVPTASAQNLPSSGLEWRQPAMPLQYWDATGRRAAAFGRQDGKFEAWVWPVKVLHGFRLEFRQDGMPEAVRGEDWLREVITRPESTTLVYVHPKFTVRETVWTPLDRPAVNIFFEVDSAKPLNITAKFVPDFKPMWPASFGGQHTWWIADDKAFGLGDALEKHVAIIGSPAVAAYTDFTDHSLIGGEMLLGLRVLPHPSKTGLGGPPQVTGSDGPPQQAGPALMVIALGMSGEKEAREHYHDAVQHAREDYETKAAYWKTFLDSTTQIETPDPIINRAWMWGKVAMNSGWVCTPVPGNEGIGTGDRAGCGMVAGYGPAGDGERPGFAWWFGGDGLIATWAMEDYGSYISEDDAQQHGYRPAYGKTCGGGASPSKPATEEEQATPSQRQHEGRADVKVWVNTSSGVYHCPGTRWYGATKAGEYMSQTDAQDKGYRPAYGKVCN
ncbi:MAG: hypothetical protein ACRD3E_06605 [Terriglobales bacterium]